MSGTVLQLRAAGPQLRVLCIGAHSDDIEIGCAGTVLRWMGEYPLLHVTWVVLSANGPRRVEAENSAEQLLAPCAEHRVVLGDFDDAHMPAAFSDAKRFLEGVKAEARPDVVLTHRVQDAHQDHRLVGELTWQAWRDHLILEYEVPKYEGDLGNPNFYVPLSDDVARRKVDHLMKHFASQRSKDWFDERTFSALMRIRGIECRSESGWAEAFHARKVRL